MGKLHRDTTVGGLNVLESLPPIGSIVIDATAGNKGAYSNQNFKKCDGSALDREEYKDLFNAIGIKHGEGNGETTFNIPKITDDRFVRGASNTFLVGNKKDWALKSHTHTYQYRATSSLKNGALLQNTSDNAMTYAISGVSTGSGSKVLPKRMSLLFYIRVK